MTYLTFNWHNSVTSWNIFIRFSAKRFTLVALSVYNNYTEIVKLCHLIFKVFQYILICVSDVIFTAKGSPTHSEFTFIQVMKVPIELN